MKTFMFCEAIQHFKTNVNKRSITSKGLGILGMSLAFAALPALAQVPSGPASQLTTAVITPRNHGPIKEHVKIDDSTGTSSNWSGFAVTGSDFTYAKGSWHVPEVDCTKTPNTYSAFWVGIDGDGDDTVEQTGTASDCSGTTAQYYAWYEFYPAGSVVIDMAISPGDVMGASVTYSNGEFTVGIHNHTTGAEYSKTATVSGAKRTSAEWIAEAPCCTSGGGILPLADFDVVRFGEDYNSDPKTNYATDSAVTDGSILAFGSNRERITMVYSGGDKAVPTYLTSDGTSFEVDWKHE
jgi:hypothetical protein